ncbi:MAG: hypothetical protein ACRDZR_02735 [Acidimicrobiales bacterium]
MGNEKETKGIEYRPGVTGKKLFRVSERYVADHIAPLVKARRTDAAKLDLILRGLALLPQHKGRRRVGTVLRAREHLDYSAMHDLVRDRHRFSTAIPEDEDADPVERDKKREWVREQLQILEARHLLTRVDVGDGRHQVIMLCDLGTGAPYDDPGAARTRRLYLTIPGSVLAQPEFRDWGSPELVGFLCALVGDRYARNMATKRGWSVPEHGAATWYRQADWFNNKNGYRPEGNIALPFSTSTIERGLKSMRDRGYISGHRTKRNPAGGRFLHPRVMYTNQFDRVGAEAEVIDITTHRRTA